VFFVVLTGEALKPFGNYDVVLYGALLVTVMIWCPRGLLDGFALLWQAITIRRRRTVA